MMIAPHNQYHHVPASFSSRILVLEIKQRHFNVNVVLGVPVPPEMFRKKSGHQLIELKHHAAEIRFNGALHLNTSPRSDIADKDTKIAAVWQLHRMQLKGISSLIKNSLRSSNLNTQVDVEGLVAGGANLSIF